MRMRGRFYVVAVFIGCLLLGGLPVQAVEPAFGGHNEKRPRFTFGVTADVISDVDTKDAKAALEVWIGEIGRAAGLSTECFLYENLQALEIDFRAGRLDIVNMNSLAFLNFRKKNPAELMFGGIKDGKKKQRYLVLVPAGESWERIHDLRRKRLALQTKSEIELLFLDTLLLRNQLPAHPEFFSSVSQVRKASGAVMAVFFNKADVCVVPEVVFRIMQEMNPQIGKKLAVLATSSELLPVVSCSPKGLPLKTKEAFFETASLLKATPRGRQLLMLFQSEDVCQIDETDLETLMELFSDYQQFRQKN